MATKSPVFKLKRVLLYLSSDNIHCCITIPYILDTCNQFTKKRRNKLYSESFTLENYITIFTSDRFSIVTPLFNSIRVSLSTTAICIILSVLAAYAFARLKFKGSNTVFVILIFTEMLPPIALLIPFFLLYQRLHLFQYLVWSCYRLCLMAAAYYNLGPL